MTDVFENKPTETPVVTPPANPAADAIVNKLMSITDASGRPKYTDLDKALDALKHAQDHIPTLERDNATLRQQASEVDALKAQIEQFRAQNAREEKPQAQTQPQGGLNEEAVAKIVRDTLSGEGQKVIREKNISDVSDVLAAKYGDKVGDILEAKAASLGLTKADLKEMSATKPKLVLSLFDGATAPNSPNPTLGNIRPPQAPQNDELKSPEKSLLSGPGATGKKRAEYMAQVRESVYKRLGVTTN